MGNKQSNPCKVLGFQGKQIGTAQLEELWNKYDKNHNGILEAEEVEAFCHDFGQAIDHPISSADASQLFQTHATGSGLTKEQFFGLFVDFVHDLDASDPGSSRLSMTQSLVSHGTDAVPSAMPISEMQEVPSISETQAMPPMAEMQSSSVPGRPPMGDKPKVILDKPSMSETTADPILLFEDPPRKVRCKK